MSSIKLTRKEKERKVEKDRARSDVFDKMVTLVGALWTSSPEYKARSKKARGMEPDPAHRIKLVETAASMIISSYEHDRDIIGAHKHNYRYQLKELQQYLDNPVEEGGDFWDGLDSYDDKAGESERESKSKSKSKRIGIECKPKYHGVSNSWLTRD